MSDSVQPHRRQPTRLPSPWDSPGKNTGVGCHVLLHPMIITEHKRKKKDFLFSPGINSANEKLSEVSQWKTTVLRTLNSSNRTFVYSSPPFFSLLYLLYLLTWIFTWLIFAESELHFFVIPNKPIFHCRNNWQSIYVKWALV